MINIKLFKLIIMGLLLLFLFHFESLSVGPLKISHIWKGVLLVYLIFVLIDDAKIKPYVYGPLLLLSVLQIFNVELINNPFNAVLLFGTTIIIPLLGMYAFKFSYEQLHKLLLFFASFFILSFFPYKLGLLQSIGDGYELTGYGSDSQGLIGPFQGAHAASTAVAASLLVVTYNLFTSRYNKVYLSFLFVSGFYFLFATYVRTGMAMFAIGLLPIILYFGKKNGKNFLRLLIVGSITTILILTWVLSNDALISRITGERKNQSEFSSFENLGSGRGLIYKSAIEIYIEANVFEKALGVGQTQQLSRMKEKIGKALVPHNGFLLILLNTGMLGFIVFMVFLKKVYSIYKSSNEEEKVLLQALFLAYCVMSFFQDFNMLYAALLMMIAVPVAMKPREPLKNSRTLA